MLKMQQLHKMILALFKRKLLQQSDIFFLTVWNELVCVDFIGPKSHELLVQVLIFIKVLSKHSVTLLVKFFPCHVLNMF
jgi:hypothetical protein